MNILYKLLFEKKIEEIKKEAYNDGASAMVLEFIKFMPFAKSNQNGGYDLIGKKCVSQITLEMLQYWRYNEVLSIIKSFLKKEEYKF